MPKVCGACGADGATKQCSACQRAWYCDRNCQKGAWKTHKKACKKVAAAAAAQATGAKKSPAFPADQQREMVRARRAIQKMGLLMNYKGLANAAGRLCDQERLLPDDFSKSIQDMDRLYACTVGLAALMMRPRVMSNWAMEEAVDGKVARGPLQIDLIGSRLGNEGMMDFAMLVQVLEEAFDGFGRFRGLVVRLIGPQMDFRADPDAAAAYRAGVARAVAQVGDRMADSRFSPLKITQVVKLYHDTNPDDKGRLAVALNAGLMAGFKTWAPTIAFCKQHGIPLAVTGYSSCHLDEAVETAKVFDDLGALITQPPVRNPFRVEMDGMVSNGFITCMHGFVDKAEEVKAAGLDSIDLMTMIVKHLENLTVVTKRLMKTYSGNSSVQARLQRLLADMQAQLAIPTLDVNDSTIDKWATRRGKLMCTRGDESGNIETYYYE